MSENNFRWTAVSFWVGGLLLVITSAVIYTLNVLNDITALAILLGTVLMMTTFFTYLGFDKSGKDERARKIGTRSATWSWYITILFTAMVLAFDIWSGRQFESPRLLATIVFIMTFSMLFTNAWYSRRGDVE